MKLFIFLMLITSLAFAGNPEEIDCQESNPVFPSPSHQFFKCKFPVNSEYNPPGFNSQYPMGLLIPTKAGKFPIVLYWDGYGDASICPTWDSSRPDKIVVKNCPDYYAGLKQGGTTLWGFGGPYLGNSPAARFSAAVDKLQYNAVIDINKPNWNNKVDWGAGLTFTGSSYGASTAMLQPLMFYLVNQQRQAQITKVIAQQAVLGFVDAGGLYYKNPNVPLAWAGTDLSLMDHAAQADKLKFIYFSIVGSPRDGVVPFHQEWFTQVCDEHKISCYGLWHDCGHALPSTSCGGSQPYDNPFSSNKQDVRLDDDFMVIFTHSSANISGPIGNYNGGLAWDSSTISTTEYTANVDLRYLKMIDIHPTVSNQPDNVTVDITVRLRESSLLTMSVGDIFEWNFNEQTGQTIVLVPGELTVNVTIPSSSTYTTLSLIKTGVTPGC